MNKKILFITECGSKKFLGFGHIFRCINIANFIKKKYKIFFCCENSESHHILKKKKIKLINSSEKYNDYFNYIFCDLPNSNHIDFKKFKYRKLIIIDEFNNFKKKIVAKVFSSNNIKKFLFLKFSHILKSPERKKKYPKKLNFIVSFGGYDYYNISPKIYNVLNKIKFIKFKFLSKLTNRNLIPKNKIIKKYATLFKSHKIDCYIGSGGNTMFEMLTHKVTCLIIPTNKIEEKYATYLSKFYKVRIIKLKDNFLENYNKTKKKREIFIDKAKIKSDYKLIFNQQRFLNLLNTYLEKYKYINILSASDLIQIRQKL